MFFIFVSIRHLELKKLLDTWLYEDEDDSLKRLLDSHPNSKSFNEELYSVYIVYLPLCSSFCSILFVSRIVSGSIRFYFGKKLLFFALNVGIAIFFYGYSFNQGSGSSLFLIGSLELIWPFDNGCLFDFGCVNVFFDVFVSY